MLHLNIEKNIYVSNITTTVVVFIDTIVTLYVIEHEKHVLYQLI